MESSGEFSIHHHHQRCAFWGEQIIVDATIHFAIAWNPILFSIGISREWSLTKGAKMSPLIEILVEFELPIELWLYSSYFSKCPIV